jgi:hypothetical protein
MTMQVLSPLWNDEEMRERKMWTKLIVLEENEPTSLTSRYQALVEKHRVSAVL